MGKLTFPTVLSPEADPLAVALGLVNWNMNWLSAQSTSAPASQTIYVSSIWLPFGKPITHLSSLIGTAASGTSITGGYMGLCSPTTMIAQTGNIGAASSAYPQLPLIAALAGSVTSYTPNSTDSALGMYYVMLLLNGTFGTTQPQFARGINLAGSGNSPSGGSLIPYGTAGTSQATLPANGAPVTLTAGALGFVVGCAP